MMAVDKVGEKAVDDRITVRIMGMDRNENKITRRFKVAKGTPATELRRLAMVMMMLGAETNIESIVTSEVKAVPAA